MKHECLYKAIKWLEKVKRAWILFIRRYTIEEHRMNRGYWMPGCTLTICYLCLISFFVSLLLLLVFKKDSDDAKRYGILAVLVFVAFVFVGLLLIVMILKKLERKNNT